MAAHTHRLESNVRSYSRAFPVEFQRAVGSELFSKSGERFLDFLAGAGSLNYGHNNPKIRKAVIAYLEDEGIVHGLDMSTVAKNAFIESFQNHILKPRKLDYKLQFCGPTGTNAVEAALKIARKVTRRRGVISFTNGFHGMTLGALAVTGNAYHRKGIPDTASTLTNFMPYDGYVEGLKDSTQLLRQYLEDNSSGVDRPAAVILETVQGEGGINAASVEWLKSLRALCDEFGILIIVDDIQMGCGRTGTFFSFEEAGIVPDIVTLSKSIGAYGMPMALVLLRPDLDQWEPGQHNGTFRGNNLAFVAAREAIETYWATPDFAQEIQEKNRHLRGLLNALAQKYPEAGFRVKGRGLAMGLQAEDASLPNRVREECFARRLIVETCGSEDQVIKFLPPLTTSKAELSEGIAILDAAINAALEKSEKTKADDGKKVVNLVGRLLARGGKA